jgi:hypothetical protein
MSAQAHITPACALKRLKAGIRAECAKQGIDDATRRALMQSIAGVDSSTKLTLAEAKEVLWHLQKCSDRAKKPDARRRAEKGTPEEWRFVFSQPPERQPLLKKIYHLAEIAGSFQNPPVAVMPKHWVEGILAQMRGIGGLAVTRLEICAKEELVALVQALAAHVGRRQETGGRRQSKKLATALQGCRSDAIGKGFLSPPQWLQ